MISLRQLFQLWSSPFVQPVRRQRAQSLVPGEVCEERVLLSGDTLPVLMVIADQQDFYYQEYGDTRASIEAAGLDVVVSATTTNTSLPHPNTGEPSGESGAVTPDIALADVNADDYSGIVFVGGWGSSMYQYDFPGDYSNNRYDGDLATKETVNRLINEFTSEDKTVGAICHGVTVLAWARVDGESLLEGRQVSVPYIGSPAVLYEGMWYNNFELGQYEQVTANGAIANIRSGQYGDPNTATDDVVVDGNIITAENYDSAAYFGTVIADAVRSSMPTGNQAPTVQDASWQIDENSSAGTVVGTVSASDPDVGQSLSYSIIAGNDSGAFAIDGMSGQITVADASQLDFETTPVFDLTIQVSDDAATSLSAQGKVTIQLNDLDERPSSPVFWRGSDLVVQGTDEADTIYLWSGQSASNVHVWMNGTFYGGFNLPESGRLIAHGGAGNDQIYATSMRTSVSLFGDAGHDRLTGGTEADQLSGGDGVDVIWGNQGDDLIQGDDGDDHMFGGEGNDLLIGGDGVDNASGGDGRDILIGGLGRDYLKGEADDDLLIGGFTDFDQDPVALRNILAAWTGPGTSADRLSLLSDPSTPLPELIPGLTVHDDGAADVLCSGEGANLFFVGAGDSPYGNADDLFA